jgi:hypothetical protein
MYDYMGVFSEGIIYYSRGFDVSLVEMRARIGCLEGGWRESCCYFADNGDGEALFPDIRGPG